MLALKSGLKTQAKCEQKFHGINSVEYRTPDSVASPLASDKRSEIHVEDCLWQTPRSRAHQSRGSTTNFKFTGLLWKMTDTVDQKRCFSRTKWHFQRTHLKTQVQHLWLKEGKCGKPQKEAVVFSMTHSGIYTAASEMPRDISEAALSSGASCPWLVSAEVPFPNRTSPRHPWAVLLLTLQKPILKFTSSHWNQMSICWQIAVKLCENPEDLIFSKSV